MISQAYRPAFLVLAAAFSMSAQSQTNGIAPTLLERVREQATPAGMLWDNTCSTNAALMVFKDSLSMARAGISAHQSKCSKPVVTQEGTGQTAGCLAAEAYHRLSPASSVWGKASYSLISLRKIRFADIIDYRLVGPYTLGDDTGGDMHAQRYEIGGGWSRKVSGRWSVGIKASYRAEIAHRSQDPRVKDIVSDLNLSAGGALNIGSNWIVGVKADFTTYNQDADVDFLNPANKIITQLYTGLGNVYRRFGGNTVTESTHSLTAFGFGVQLLPAQGHGLMADITANTTRCNMYLRGYNNIKPAYTGTTTLRGNISWSAAIGNNIEVAPSLEALVVKRQGTENLFNIANGGNYSVIGSRENYRHNIYDVALNLPVRWRSASNDLGIRFEPTVRVVNEKEQLLSPERIIKVRHIIPGAIIGADYVLGGRTMLRVTSGCSYRTSSGAAPVWGDLDAHTPEGAAVISDYDMRRSNALAVNASMGLSRIIDRILVNLDITWSYQRYSHIATGRSLGASLSITF